MDLNLELKRRVLAEEGVVTMRKETEQLEPSSPERKAVSRKVLEDTIKAMEALGTHKPIWDFSKEKSQPVFVSDCNLVLRPINAGDVDFYWRIKQQYSPDYRAILKTESHRKESLFLVTVCTPESFYCIVEINGAPVGYLGIENTEEDLWQLAAELDEQYTNQGFGSRSVKLFLNEVSRISGKTLFRAKIYPDNIRSQKCVEKVGGKLVGLCVGGYLRLPEEQARFEEENLHLIDDNIQDLADRLGVEPRKLLSHVLDYRLECPI